MDIVTIASERGINKDEAEKLLKDLPAIIEQRDVLSAQYDEVIRLDIESVETEKKAKALRLLIQKNRTQGIMVWHKTNKEFFLRGGQFVDAVKNKEIAINERMESDLKEIEDYQENIRIKKQGELRQSRLEYCKNLLEFIPSQVDLGLLQEDEFLKIFNGAKLQYEAKLKYEAELEAERALKIKLDRIEIARNLEIAEFKGFVDQLIDIRNSTDEEYASFVNGLRIKKSKHEAEQVRIRKENEELRKQAEEKERKLKETLANEAAKQKLLESQLQAQKDAQDKAKKEEDERNEELRKQAEELRKSPVKQQLKSWINAFNIEKSSIDHQVKLDIEEKFKSFKNWALKQVETI